MALSQVLVMAASALILPVAAAEAAATNTSTLANSLVSLRGASGAGSTTSQSCTASYAYDCRSSPSCCEAGFTCYEKDEHWAACRDQTCTPGAPMTGDVDLRPWTCQVLGGQPAQAPAPPAPATPCEDRNSDCAAWAAIGECTKNPGYMEVMCKQSCNICG
mmetsp:Transcript_23862/g.59430  ORF Transcript_23862/g.59430 Transcript_23862/m.59430 type:complete len:161 (-) Transcript_23862:103-585(-)